MNDNRWGTRIKDLLKKRNMKQKDLSKLSGVSESTLSDWIKGTREPGVYGLSQVAQSLGVTLDYLMGLDSVATEIQTLTGYSLWELKGLFAAGYTLEAPKQISMEELLQELRKEAHESM